MSAVRCNINVSSYDGDVSFAFDCVRNGQCKFGLFETMPPEEGMTCAFYRGGSCCQHDAQLAALSNLKSDINAEVKRIESENKEAR